MSSILQKLSKIPKNSPKISAFFYFIARAPFGEYPLISCSVDASAEKSLICFAQ